MPYSVVLQDANGRQLDRRDRDELTDALDEIGHMLLHAEPGEDVVLISNEGAPLGVFVRKHP